MYNTSYKHSNILNFKIKKKEGGVERERESTLNGHMVERGSDADIWGESDEKY